MELTEIKGIGEKRVKSLNESGIFTPTDLLLRFPDKYIFTRSRLNEIRVGEEISFVGEVVSEATRRFIRRGLTVVGCAFACDGKTVRCSWFNQPFAARSLKRGDVVYVIGKAKKLGKAISITNPMLLTPQPDDGDIVPVYKTAIPSRTFAAAVKTALDSVCVNSYVPEDIAKKFGLMPLGAALRAVHRPMSADELTAARRSVAIENLCYVITTYRLVKDDNRDFKYNAPDSAVKKFIDSLPYELTSDQTKAINAVVSALRSDKLTNMLIQGEVGCGKTAVALCAMYFAAVSGYQSALMVPTEVLARQHYETMVKLLEPLGMRPQLLCASMTKSQRETALFNISYGTSSCIVGTQSLIGDDIKFYDLRLVIVDEQQRFGVNQRAKLESKGSLGGSNGVAGKTDMIVMTATPIPRTLALSLYGELRQVNIKTMPKNRPIVHTSVVPARKISAMFGYIGECAVRDERTYIICPRISDENDDLKGVESVYNKLRSSALGSVTACVHGKMKDAEKTEVMAAFKRGDVKVLISTTVVEVGIDVPEATNIIIVNAERFGLSQLHQMRGRVGRGTKESYCFLLSDDDDKESVERLATFCKTTDGFSVSELDFKLRGAGDFVGLRQHGNGSLEINEDVIVKARELSDSIIADGHSNASILRSMSSPEFIRSVTMN